MARQKHRAGWAGKTMKRLEPAQRQGHGVDQIYGILACNPLAESASSYQKRSSCMLRHRLMQATSTQ